MQGQDWLPPAQQPARARGEEGRTTVSLHNAASRRDALRERIDHQVPVLIHSLPNGVTAVVEPMPSASSVALNVCFEAGSRYEPEAIAGITHFCEHLIFKGTRRRTWEEIARVMNLHGGQMNAFTALEMLQIHTRVVRDDLEEAFDLVADMVLESTFDPAETERERRVILEELADTEDSPDDLAYEYFTRCLYPDHPLGRPVIGSRRSVGAITRDEAAAWWRDCAVGPRTILSVAGAVSGEEVLRIAERTFGAMPAAGGDSLRCTSPVVSSGTQCRVRDFEQVAFVIGVEGIRAQDDARYAWTLMDIILGGDMGSRLFAEVRERRGLVYGIASSSSSCRDTGAFMVGGSTSAENLPEVFSVCRAEFDKLAADGPTAQELDIAKRNVQRRTLLAADSVSSRASVNCARQFYGLEHLDMERTLERIRAVTAEDVRKAAHDAWCRMRPSVALVGPVGAVDAEALQQAILPKGIE